MSSEMSMMPDINAAVQKPPNRGPCCPPRYPWTPSTLEGGIMLDDGRAWCSYQNGFGRPLLWLSLPCPRTLPAPSRGELRRPAEPSPMLSAAFYTTPGCRRNAPAL